VSKMATIRCNYVPAHANRMLFRTNKIIVLRRAYKGKPMTVALGFRCEDGIVLCADTQITKEGALKYYQKKTFLVEGSDRWSVGFTYSGNPDVMDLVIEKMRERFLPDGIEVYDEKGERNIYLEPTIGVVREIVEEVLIQVSKKHKKEMDSLEMLCAVSIAGKALEMFRTKRTLVAEAQWECLGIGDSPLIRYLAEVFNWPHMSTKQALLLAVYMVQQAKKYVDGCGGDTDAIIFDRKGSGEKITRERIKYFEQYLESTMVEASSLFAAGIKTELSATETELLLTAICRRFKNLKTGFA